MAPCAQCFAVRSLGWVEIPEEELTPGKSSLAVNNCIQQLSHSKAEGRDDVGAWGEVSRALGTSQEPMGHLIRFCMQNNDTPVYAKQ